ncbi:unnamed protein product, partial [Adineta steineri]
MSSAQHKKVIESHVAAVCAHNIDEVMSYYDPNCEVSLDGPVVMRSKDEIKKKTEKWLSDPNYKIEIVDFLPVEGDDRDLAIIRLDSTSLGDLGIQYMADSLRNNT